jgi:hypothetical protein
LPEFHFEPEEADFVRGVLIQPIKSCAMLVPDHSSNPNDRFDVQTGSVSDELTEVLMVCGFQLILDQHTVLAGKVATKNVGLELPNSLFLTLDIQIHPDRFSEQRDIFFLSEPWCEVTGLRLPGLTEMNSLQAAKM